jgi:hypothetical protein
MNFDLIVGYLITGIVWGVTNAFMERGSKQKEQQAANEVTAGVKMFANLAFLVPFLLN